MNGKRKDQFFVMAFETPQSNSYWKFVEQIKNEHHEKKSQSISELEKFNKEE